MKHTAVKCNGISIPISLSYLLEIFSLTFVGFPSFRGLKPPPTFKSFEIKLAIDFDKSLNLKQ